MSSDNMKPLKPPVFRHRGFTLVELTIVVALICIVSAIAAPQLSQMILGMKVKSATQDVVSEMLLLKIRAIKENRKYRIIFGSPDKCHYKVQQDGNRDDDYADAVDTIVKTVSLPVGIVFDTNALKRTSGDLMCSDAICFGSDNGASFKPTGTSDCGSVYLISEEDKSSGRTDRMSAISINSTSRIKVWRYIGGSSQWENY